MKRFRIQVTIRILMIAAMMLLAVYLFAQTTAYAAAVIVVIVVGLQIRGLFKYIDKSNQDLARFLRSIRYSDFSQTFASEGRGGSYAELGGAFQEVIQEFRAARAEKEEHYRYLHTVMQHIGVGLISFKLDGTVGLVNNAAKRLLRVHVLKNIHSLEPMSKDLVDTMLRMRSGDRELVKIVENDELLQLSLSATEFKMRGDHFKLVSIQNIQSELEEKESEAWQKLTRVLTHEIMNSITPITSLASTANEMLVHYDAMTNGQHTEEVIQDVRDAVATIEKRSASLLSFVNAYRSLTRIPQPDFQIISVLDLFKNVVDLLQAQMDQHGVDLHVDVDPPGLTITADPELIERVLINLAKNALESLAEVSRPEIRLTANLDGRGRSRIQVADNGPGIEPEAIDKIFIPFFTTKKEGSGIGLSLSREIMRQHAGTIAAFSQPGVKTVFTLRF